MPENLDFALYFNIVFFSVIGLGFLIGYFRGLKKTLYALITTVIFYAFFFLTIDQVVAQLWVLPIPFAFDYLVGMLPELSGQSTIGAAVFVLLESYTGDTLGATLDNEVFLSFVTGLSQFALKLVYMVLYFTVGQILYKWLAAIIRAIFFSGKKKNKKTKLEKIERIKKSERVKYTRKEKKRNKKLDKKLAIQAKKDEKKRIKKEKKQLLGALVGAAKGVVSAFVTMILLGGVLNMMGGLVDLLPESSGGTTAGFIEPLYVSASYVPLNVTPLADDGGGFTIPSELEPQLDQARDMVTAFDENIFVQNASKLLITSPEYAEPVAMHLYLFDSVFSFEFEENKIMLRKELNTISQAGGVLLGSDYLDSNDISDITSEEIIAAFNAIAESELITSLIPLVIEVGSDYYDMPVEIPVDELYAIDWRTELMTLGAVVAVGFDLVNTAGILDEGTDLETVTLDGTEVRGLFDSLADSELATLSAFIAMQPLLEEMGGQASAIITVPTDLEWGDEFAAFGEVAEAILDTGITVGDLKSGDPNLLISSLADLDFTVLLSSQIVSHALKNIFSGEAGIEGLDMLVIPDGIVWFDVYEDGVLVTEGEIRNILLAVNAINSVADGFDFDNLDFNIIADFDDPTIDTIFNSELLVASISGFILDMDLGDTPLIIPDSILDLNGYIKKEELKAVASSARVLVVELECDEGDTTCEETGFDIAKAFGLQDTDIDTLISSDILAATIGQLIVDSGGDILTIPNSALESILVDAVAQDVITKLEIKNLFKAVSVLGFTDLDNMAFDASIISYLETVEDSKILDTTKSDKLFGSKIVHATLSEMMFDLTSGEDSVLNVPYFDVDSAAIRVYDATDELDYVLISELEDILQALLTLDIADFNDIDSLDLDLIITNSATLLQSAILHATISQQVFDLGSEVISVPYKDEGNNDIRVTVGVVLESTDTEYITKAEITSILDALEILGITDISSFDGTVDLASITEEPGNMTIMLGSAIIHATISDQLIQLDTDGTISIPHLEEDNTTAVRVIVGAAGFETEYVTKDEINAVIDALDVLDILDVESFDGTVDLSLLTVGGNKTIVLASSILQATISKQLIDLDTDGTVELPYFKEDDVTAIRFVVGTGANTTEYVLKTELEAMIDAMDVLDITDIESFSGSVNIATLSEGTNSETVLESAMIQATVSKQVLNLVDDPGMSATFIVPYFGVDNLTNIRISVGNVLETTDTEYISADELCAMIDGLNILGITDVETFDGSIDLTDFFVEANRDILLTSAIMQATISKQLIDLGDATLMIPIQDVDTIPVRITVGALLEETEYVSKDEIGAMFEALEVLEITDISSFSGTIDLNNVYGDTNQDILLSSAAIHATITKQMDDLGPTVLVIPDADVDGVDVKVTVLTFEFIVKAEIKAMINALETLGITDISSFSGTIDLNNVYGDTNQDILLSSAAIHATITKQMVDLGDAVLLIPDADVDGIDVKVTVLTFEFIVKAEIKAMINALELLGIDDISTFNGTIDLSNVYGNTNQTILLSSAAIHATITEQMVDLGPAVLYIPDTDISDVAIRLTVSGFEFLVKDEIKAMINALEVLGISDINSFSGAFDLALLSTSAAQNTLLSSASIHATITETMLDLDDAVLIVPLYTQAGELPGNEIRLTVSGFEFVVKDEIKALINAFNEMGYTDLDSFGGSLDSSEFFDGRATLLLSSSIQVTLSDKMLNDTGGELVVPDSNINTATLIRLVHADVTYIELTEMNAILDGLDELGLTDFSSMSFSPANVFTADFDLILLSASIQATISDNILPTALDETAPTGSTTIIVPTHFREDITVDGTPKKHIEKVELKSLLSALDELGVADFGGGMNSSTITNMTDTQLATMLVSGSVHTTIDNMMRGNANINSEIPVLAEEDTDYKTNIIIKQEIRDFIAATKIITTGSFTTVSFDAAAIKSLNATEQGIVAESMIVRNILTPTLETACAAVAYPLLPTDYEEDNITYFLRKVQFLAIINALY